MPQYADPVKVMEIADKLSVKWASLLERLSDYDGPERDEES